MAHQHLGEFVDDLAEVIFVKRALVELGLAKYDDDKKGVSGVKMLDLIEPVALRRVDSKFAKNQSYWFSEKTIGERHVLITLRGHGVFLVTRTLSVFRIPEVNLFLSSKDDGTLLQDKTLLDVDVVENFYHRRTSILLCDVFALEGEVVANEKFSKRIQIMSEIYNGLRSRGEPERMPVLVHCKEWYNMNHRTYNSFQRLVTEMETPELLFKRRYFVNDSKKIFRHDEVEGIIFMPDESLVVAQQHNLVKVWRYSDQTRVAFAIQLEDGMPRNTFTAFVRNDEGELMYFREIMVPQGDMDRFWTDLNSFQDHAQTYPVTGVVATFHFEAMKGMWRYVELVQPDQGNAATYYDVMSVLEIAAEAITDKTLPSVAMGHGPAIARTPNQARTPGVPQTPVTPSTPTSGGVHVEEKTGSPSPTQNGGSNKRPINDVYSPQDDVPDAENAKRARTKGPGDKPTH